MVDITIGYSRSKTVALVDVGDDGISIAIASVPHSGPVHIIASGRSVFSLEKRGESQSAARISAHIKEAGESVLRSAVATNMNIQVASVYVTMHAPWTESETVSQSEKFESEVLIKDSTISKLAKESLADLHTVDTSRIIDAHVFMVALNGYETLEPEGKYAHSIDVTSIISDCNTAIRKAVTSSIGSLFPVAKIHWRSALRSYTTIAAALHQYEYVLIDVGTDITHISSIRGHMIAQRTVQEGVRTMLKRVSGGRSDDETISALKMLSRDACSTETCESVSNAMATAEPELVKLFGESMAEFKASKGLPNRVYLTVHSDIEFWLSRFFARIDFSQFTVTTMPFDVQTPDSYAVHFVDSSVSDGPLLAAAALVNIESRT